MKIYTVIVQDSHSDTTAHPFTRPERAVEWARLRAKEYCHFPEDYKERQIDGWLFYARYSCEGDCVYVAEMELDGELKEENEND